MTAPAWSKDQPLRADATDAQILVRTQWHWDNNKLISMKKAQVLVAREFAAAAVAASGSPPSPPELPIHAWARCGHCAKIVHAIIGATPEETQERVRRFTSNA